MLCVLVCANCVLCSVLCVVLCVMCVCMYVILCVRACVAYVRYVMLCVRMLCVCVCCLCYVVSVSPFRIIFMFLLSLATNLTTLDRVPNRVYAYDHQSLDSVTCIVPFFQQLQ